MPQVTIDAELMAKLLDLGEPAELVDADGNVVGRFVPDYKPSISEAELERRSQPGRKKYTTEEVLEKLRKLA